MELSSSFEIIENLNYGWRALDSNAVIHKSVNSPRINRLP